MNLVIIITLILFAMLYLKFRTIRHKINLSILLLLIIFVVLATLTVIGSDDVNFTSANGIITAGKIYVASFINFVDNVLGITSYAVEQDWRGNFTNSTEK